MVNATRAGGTERSVIAPLIQRLLALAINSPIKLHLVLLFHENPRLKGSARQISQRIYRDIWSTQEALGELAGDGILGIVGGSGGPIYSYDPRSEHRAAIARLVERYDDPFARDQIHDLLRESASEAAYRRNLARNPAEATVCACGCPSLYDTIGSIAS